MNQNILLPSPDRRRHRLVTGFAVLMVGLMLAILAKGLMLNPDAGTNALLDKPAKQFQVSWLSGNEYVPQAPASGLSLADLKGKPFILNFWASWCVSCRSEAQIMEAYWQAHKHEGILVVGIAIQDSPDMALQFAQYFGKSYPLGLDEDGHASIDYGVTGVPETFFIDERGFIRHKIAGPVDFPSLEKYGALLKAPPKS